MTQPTEKMRTLSPRLRRRHPTARRTVLVSLALLVALVATLVFVYQRAATDLDQHLKAESAVTHYVAVFFVPTATSAMSYDNIVTFMSSYGMRLDNSFCAPYDLLEPEPESQESYWLQKDPFLTLLTTTLAPLDWEQQLRALPIVEGIDTKLRCDGDGIPRLQRSWPGRWRSVTNPFFSPLRNPASIQLHAIDTKLNYEHSVCLALEMGFRLADPTYEAAKNRGEAPSWHPVSQADMFASQRTLLVAPTLGTPRDWKSQVEATHEFSIGA